MDPTATPTKSINAQRLANHAKKMQAYGFKRLNCYIGPKLQAFLDETWKQGQCSGRQLEALLLGEAEQRPAYYTAQERREREMRRQRNVAKFAEKEAVARTARKEAGVRTFDTT